MGVCRIKNISDIEKCAIFEQKDAMVPSGINFGAIVDQIIRGIGKKLN